MVLNMTDSASLSIDMASRMADASTSSLIWKAIVLRHAPKFVWLRFMPLHGAHLAIMMPKSRFSQMLESGIRASVPLVALNAMRNDHVVEGGFVPGALYLEPDLCSAYIHPGQGLDNRVVMVTSFVDSDGVAAANCPRSLLARLAERLRTEYRLAVLLGFEVEVVFMRTVDSTHSPDFQFARVGNHSWCHVPAEEAEILQIVEEVVSALTRVDAAVEKFHAESAPGQWEFVLSPRTPVEAVDMLLRARETIMTIAQQHGLRATLHPRPYPFHAGTGAHIHISATPMEKFTDSGPDPDPNTKKVESFFAGILHHLPSIAAFAMPLDASYSRIGSGMWSGGEYACWGWENRETPLRRITTTRFEFKLMCGTANPYLTLAAILAGALDGLESLLPLVSGDCKGEPARLSAEARSHLQITVKLPTSIEESLGKLREDSALARELGQGLIEAYIAVTTSWNAELRQMETEERENWIIAHY